MPGSSASPPPPNPHLVVVVETAHPPNHSQKKRCKARSCCSRPRTQVPSSQYTMQPCMQQNTVRNPTAQTYYPPVPNLNPPLFPACSSRANSLQKANAYSLLSFTALPSSEMQAPKDGMLDVRHGGGQKAAHRQTLAMRIIRCRLGAPNHPAPR